MKKLVLILVTGFLASCADHKDTLVVFMEKEAGIDAYQTRMIITKEYVRVDDGEGSKSFVLFDRLKKVVYSINPEEKSVMSVHAKTFKEGEKVEPPIELKHSSKEIPTMKDAPTIESESAKHYQLMTNNEVCYDVVSIKSLMPHVVTALKEFHQHMATDSMTTFNNMPADLHNACDMTLTTFKPTRQLDFGFPIQEWDNRGYMRSLVDYNADYKVDPALFVFPEGYKHYSVQELREGRVQFDK